MRPNRLESLLKKVERKPQGDQVPDQSLCYWYDRSLRNLPTCVPKATTRPTTRPHFSMRIYSTELLAAVVFVASLSSSSLRSCLSQVSRAAPPPIPRRCNPTPIQVIILMAVRTVSLTISCTATTKKKAKQGWFHQARFSHWGEVT
uniref:Uncharacterized protein n=1 Tax=Hyaloperonospora arabidopsidis (strain Emoy2) TaxID=559515 RepID=M4BFQ6_HYAAE